MTSEPRPVKSPETTGATAQSKTSLRRQNILDTAATLFAEKGIIATTVRDISKQAGMLSGSLYHHFASKEEMIAEILAPVVKSQVDAFDRIAQETNDPSEILVRSIAAEIAQTAANPRVARILRQDEHHIRELPGLDEVVRQQREIRTRMEAIIATGIETGRFRSDADPVVTAKVIFDAVLGAFRHLQPIGPYTPDELTRELTSFIVNGLRAG